MIDNEKWLSAKGNFSKPHKYFGGSLGVLSGCASIGTSVSTPRGCVRYSAMRRFRAFAFIRKGGGVIRPPRVLS